MPTLNGHYPRYQCDALRDQYVLGLVSHRNSKTVCSKINFCSGVISWKLLSFESLDNSEICGLTEVGTISGAKANSRQKLMPK